MKKLLLSVAIMATSFTTIAQVGIGTTTPKAALDVESTTQGFLLPRMLEAEMNAIVTPSEGLQIYCTDCTPKGLMIFNNPRGWESLVSTPATVTNDCAINGFEGTYFNLVALSGTKFSVTVTNNSFSTASISFGTGDLVLSGVSGITVSSVSPTSASLTAGQSQLVTYNLSGTPTSAGTLTGVWTKLSLNCTKTQTVDKACTVLISATVSKNFLCHNLGADTSLDPHVPVVGLNGAYIQWGKRGPNTTGDASVDWQTAANDGPNGFAAAPTASNANAGSITGWSTSAAANGSWNSGTEAVPVKTANDPCPTGYRVPTRTEWTGVNTNNTASLTGPFTNSSTQYGSALHYGPDASTKLLTLPAAGNRNDTNGALSHRGFLGFYWSSTESGSPAYILIFNSSSVNPAANYDRSRGLSLRCIAE
jgi:uncharacterized protein (TIGR02145 family)